MHWRAKSGCEKFGTVVLIDTSLGSSVVESKSKEANRSAGSRQSFQEGEDESLLRMAPTRPGGDSPKKASPP